MKKSRFKQLKRSEKRAAKAKAELATAVEARGGSPEQVQLALLQLDRLLARLRLVGTRS